MGSVLVSASMRRVYEQEQEPPQPPAPRPLIPPSRMQDPPHPTAQRLLPFDLQLLMGTSTLTLFPRGPFDEMTFFQRAVPGEHDLEFVTWCDEDQGETVRGYGMFNLKGPSEPILKLSHEYDLWERLEAQHRLRRLPDARTILIRRPKTYDPLVGPRSGINQVAAPYGDHFRAEGQRAVSTHRALQILAELCRPRQLIAWIESGVTHPPPDTILHRYYIDARKTIYLVRQQGRSRRLFLPRRCAEGDVPAAAASASPVPEWPPTRRA